MVFENQNVFESAILLQVQDPVTESPKHIFDTLQRHGVECFGMVRRLNHNFMRAHTVHLVKHSIRLPVQVSFDPQCRKFVRDHAQVPPGGVWPGVFSRTVGQYLWRRSAFITRTKWAESALQDNALTGKISGTFGAVSGNNNPASGNRIFSQLRHNYYLTTPEVLPRKHRACAQHGAAFCY